jgi:hypothetical protein
MMTAMSRRLPIAIAVIAGATLLSAADPKFTSVWKSPDAYSVNFAGKKLAALVIAGDESLRVSGEEALVRELTSRGFQAVATYRIAPKEELKEAERAKGWFERANVEGVIALRPVRKEARTSYNPGTWVSPYYGTMWGYYGYGWGSVYIPGRVDRDEVVVVESLIFSVPKNQLLWAAVSETKDSKTLQKFIGDLVKASVEQLHKQGLAKGLARRRPRSRRLRQLLVHVGDRRAQHRFALRRRPLELHLALGRRAPDDVSRFRFRQVEDQRAFREYLQALRRAVRERRDAPLGHGRDELAHRLP